MLTDLQKARMLIQDSDPSNQIFTDEEINEILSDLRKRKVLKAQKATVDGKLYTLEETLSRATEDAVVYDSDENVLTGTVNYETSTVTFTENPGVDVYIDGNFISWNMVHGKLLEIIATDMRKWNTYSAGGLSETFSKQDLLNYARSMFPVRGAW
jgi:Flp pilus assembly protein TadG